MLSFFVSEAMRDLRRAGRVGLSAILLITLSLGALGCFWLVSLNLGRAVTQWRERVRVVVYLREEPKPAAVEDLIGRVQALGGVQRVRYVSRAEALASLKRSLGQQASVVDHLPRNPLPASLELTPDEETATPEGTRALVQRLSALPEVEEVQGGAEWVESLAQWQRLFQLTGLGVGAVLALAGLEVAYVFLAPRLEPLLNLTLGLGRAAFLSAPQVALLLAGGAMLGALGGLLAKGRAEA